MIVIPPSKENFVRVIARDSTHAKRLVRDFRGRRVVRVESAFPGQTGAREFHVYLEGE